MTEKEALAPITADLVPSSTNPAAVYLARLHPSSRRTMLSGLRAVVRIVGADLTVENFPWAQLRYEHVAAIRAALFARCKPRSAQCRMSALNGVLHEAWRLGQISTDDYHRAIDHDTVKVSTLLAGRALSAGEMRSLIEACPGTTAGRRNAAIVSVLYGAMLRRSEASGLDLADFSPADASLRVVGKGRKERLAYLPTGALLALQDWLAVRGSEPGPLFHPIDQRGFIVRRRLCATGIAKILAGLTKRAGVAKCTPHDFRRTGISDLLDAGADLASVAKLVGHSDPATTASYDRRPERARRQAAEKLHVPYKER